MTGVSIKSEKPATVVRAAKSIAPKAEISYEIKSNYQMTNKVLKKLSNDGLITITKKR